MRRHAFFAVVGLLASTGVAQTSITDSPTAVIPTGAPTYPPSDSPFPTKAAPTTPTPIVRTYAAAEGPPTLVTTIVPTITLNSAAFIGYTLLGANYAPYYCVLPATYTASSGYAACCNGPCVLPTRCVEYYHTDVPTQHDPGQVTCVYTEFRQTTEGWASCRTSGIAPYPTNGNPTEPTEIAMLMGCDNAYTTGLPPQNHTASLFRATESPSSGGMAKTEVIAIGILVPSIVITMIGAAACYWRHRVKVQRRKTVLPAYEDCLRELRPPAYSPSPDSGPDVEPPPRTRSPPPDYAASVENLPARYAQGTAEGAEGRTAAGADPPHESHEMQNLDRSTAGSLRREREASEVERRRP